MCFLKTIESVVVLATRTRIEEPLRPGRYSIAFALEPNILAPGTYELDLTMHSGVPQDQLVSAIRFRLEANPETSSDARFDSLGVVAVDLPWTALERVPDGAARTALA
jgi:hypothetical protein